MVGLPPLVELCSELSWRVLLKLQRLYHVICSGEERGEGVLAGTQWTRGSCAAGGGEFVSCYTRGSGIWVRGQMTKLPLGAADFIFLFLLTFGFNNLRLEVVFHLFQMIFGMIFRLAKI